MSLRVSVVTFLRERSIHKFCVRCIARHVESDYGAVYEALTYLGWPRRPLDMQVKKVVGVCDDCGRPRIVTYAIAHNISG